MEHSSGSLARRCLHDFTAGVRRRGEMLFAADAVRLFEQSREALYAGVDDDTLCDVSLQIRFGADGSDLVPSCSCQHAAPGRCQHVWALVLTADARSWGEGLGAADDEAVEAAGGRCALPVHRDDGALDDEQDEEDEDDVTRKDVWATHSRGQFLTRQKLPDWRSLLAHLDVTSARDLLAQKPVGGEGADRQCWLVIDTGESLAQARVVLDCMERRRKLNGEWGIFKPAVCSIDDFLPRTGTERAGVIRSLLSAAPTSSRQRSTKPSHFEALTLDPGMDRAWWQALVREVHVGIATQTAAGRQILPASVDERSLWMDELKVQRAAKGRDWTLAMIMQRDDGLALRIDEPLVAFASGLVLFKDGLAWMRPRTEQEFQWLALMRQRPAMHVPDAQLDRLIAKILTLQTVPRISWCEEAILERRAWSEEKSAPTPLLRMNRSVMALGSGGFVGLRLAFLYGQRAVAGDDPREVIALDGDRHVLRRDLGREDFFVQQLVARSQGLATVESKAQLSLQVEALVATLEQLAQDGWIVEMERTRVHFATATSAEVASGVDWFDLKVDCQFAAAQVGVPALLAAIAEKSPFVRLADGSHGLLPSRWLARFAQIAAVGRTSEQGWRFERSQAAILDTLLEGLPEVSCDEIFAGLRAKMQRFSGIEPAPSPSCFAGELRTYQREGLGWLGFLREFGFGGCLADDMGLGKTIQVLAALPKAGGEKPSLVVVPRSLVHNWMAEAARFRPDLNVLSYDALSAKARPKNFSGHDLVVMTYGCLRRDIARFGKTSFHYVILDEAQNIKNRDAQVARAARLIQGEHRLALSGTPVENRLEDVLSIFDFLNPGMINPSLFRRVKARSVGENVLYELLGKAIRPFILRRTKDQVLRDLPEKTEQIIFCELAEDQKKSYDELRQHFQAHLKDEIAEKGLDKSKFHVLEALLRLRQAACHVGLCDDTRKNLASAKVEALIEHLTDVMASGHKALVFSQFTSLLDIVRRRLDEEKMAYEYLDGQTRDRARRVERFQNDAKVSVFLVSLKAGGVGLNLTAASYCFILDPWWNPAAEAQAIARSHRLGQTKPVFAYRLITRGTVEEKILSLQGTKRDLAEAIVGADNALISKMSLDDLKFLLD